MHDDIAAAYDRWSAVYDSDPNATRDLDFRVVREHGPRVEGRVVVEVGCGTGKNTAWLAASARAVTAMDFSPGMLARARARLGDSSRVTFVEHDVTRPWPVADASAEVVIGNLVLEHVRDLAPVFAEVARVLVPGGRCFLCELHPARQQRGGQAHFVEPASGDTVHVPAFVHSVSEYLNGGIDAGLQVARVGEWLEEGAPAGAIPRLFSVTFVK
jgi:malonyl-CoA O-methyltransferase